MRDLWLRDERKLRALATGLFVYALALRLYFGAHIDLMPEETYYWNYSRHLDFGYLDHPPMVAWLIRGGTALFGATEFGVRIAAVCCGAITALFTYRLTKNLFGPAAAALALALLQVMPFYFLSGMLMTPDTPLTAAWAASLYFLERALIGGSARAWWWAGLCLGLGMLSKYTIGLLGLAVLIFMIVDRRSRHWLGRPQPYAAAVLAFAIFSPVIVWNAEHHWISFLFQTTRRIAGAPRFSLHKLIGASMLLLTPTGFFAAVYGLARPAAEIEEQKANTRAGTRLLRMATLVPLAVFAFFSLRREVKLDWTGAPWIAALPLIAVEIIHAGRTTAAGARAWIRASCGPSIVAMALLYPLGLYHLAAGIPGVGYSRQTELLPVGWRRLGYSVGRLSEDYRRRYGVAPLVVGMDRYVIASELAFYAPNRVDALANTSSAHLFGGSGLMYELWVPAKRQRGRTLLLVSFNAQSLDAKSVRAAVRELGPIERLPLRRGNTPIRDAYYRFASGYRGPAPSRAPRP
ncbi:MAG: glycosyltransferase family 39 protein [Gammaproteobacteria bacterium]|nr:glycosyltransferase family 39 protein [Gammaproteobacteria bacterium]MDE2349495.1 glycosyltransferase family 39 protein [Gammaproteobacteria bacterium]